ncbi:MAG TPA: VWA domain-containing protein [Vicinamibacteria bacterium]|nr:VWA domain-containing protein [Vicinamibacteria bacterium]HRB13928.1 VWA domain-containing protein [Vicinamibacteria bacterium]
MNPSALTLGIALAAALRSSTPSAPAQDPQQRPPIIIGAEVEVVSVPVIVHDKAGRFVAGLKKEDIQILEDGVPQEITYLASSTGEDRIPLSIALTLDTSGSMKGSITFLKEAATYFTGKLELTDQALVVQFNESVKSSSEFTDDTDRMDAFINGLQVWGGTALYDSVMYSLDRLRDRPGRKALILLSDGDDTSSVAGKAQVTALAKSLEVSIYAVGIQGFDTPRGFLKNLAEDTGGAYYFPNKTSELIKVFEAIAKDLKNNYLIAYSPKRAADNTYRKIEVRVNRPEVTVRVRPGYMAARKRRGQQG